MKLTYARWKFLLTFGFLHFIKSSANNTEVVSVKFDLHFYQNPGMQLGTGDVLSNPEKWHSKFSSRIDAGYSTVMHVFGMEYTNLSETTSFQNDTFKPDSQSNPFELEVNIFGSNDIIVFLFYQPFNLRNTGVHFSVYDNLTVNFRYIFPLTPPTIEEHVVLSSTKPVASSPDKKIILALSYSFLCAKYIYGNNCNKYCKAENSDSAGHFVCDFKGSKICLSGWIGSNSNCNKLEACLNNPCWNGGTCTQMEDKGSIWCDCLPEYDGFLCERCTYCKNGGTCVINNGTTTCRCPINYDGDHCQTEVDLCKKLNNPCLNGGTCNKSSVGYLCDCATGFTGINCTDTDQSTKMDNLIVKTNRNYCTEEYENPCANSGTCVNLIDTFNCSCPDGVIGSFCEMDIDECNKNPCKHNERCINTIGSYFCLLEDKDECIGVTCLNGGTCYDLDFKYYCKCTNGFSGSNCNYLVESDYSVKSDYSGKSDFGQFFDLVFSDRTNSSSVRHQSTSVLIIGVASAALLVILVQV